MGFVFDAIVLAGGRSSRLGGVDKASLRRDGTTLLATVCDGLGAARQLVIVGEVDEPPARAKVVREDPPFAGPAAAIAAGMDALADQNARAEWIAILACDLPAAGPAVDQLCRRALDGTTADALVAKDNSGHLQSLLGLYRTEPLRRALLAFDDLTGCSVRNVMRGLNLEEIEVPEGTTDDVDTWQDVEAWGIMVKDES